MAKPVAPSMVPPTDTNLPMDNGMKGRNCCVAVPIKAGVGLILVLSLLHSLLSLFVPAIDTDSRFLYAASTLLFYANIAVFACMLFFLFTINPPGFRMLAIVNAVVLVATFAFNVYSSLAIAQEYKQRGRPVPKLVPFFETESVAHWIFMGLWFVLESYWAFVLFTFSKAYKQDVKAKMHAHVNRHRRNVV